jgi:hypothetical protein
MSDALGNASEGERMHGTIGTALFFIYCWDSGMKRLPTLEDCPECNSQKQDTGSTSVF